MIWIRDALSECALYPNALGLAASRASEASGGFDFAREWVRGQKKYFGNRARILESPTKSISQFCVSRDCCRLDRAAGAPAAPAAGL